MEKLFKIVAAEALHCGFFHAFFLVKTWNLRYPQCDLTDDISVTDSGVLLVAATAVSSGWPQASSAKTSTDSCDITC